MSRLLPSPAAPNRSLAPLRQAARRVSRLAPPMVVPQTVPFQAAAPLPLYHQGF
jgi:hypothetical protein